MSHGWLLKPAAALSALLFAACSVAAATIAPSVGPATTAPTVGPAPATSPSLASPGVSPTVLPSASAAASPAASSANASAAPTHGSFPPGRIVFGQFDPTVDNFVISTVLPDGSDLRPLLPGPHQCPRWSPDGSEIAVTSSGGGEFATILRPDGSAARDLKRPDATLDLGCGAWSADGTRIAVEAWDETKARREGIYSVRTSDGGDLRRLTTPPAGVHDIPGDYSPDGTQIVYVRVTDDAHERGEVWICDSDGQQAHKVSDSPVGFTTAWSPDGRSIVADFGGALLVFDLSNPATPPRRIAVAGGVGFGARWSPDGSHFVLSFTRSGADHPDIYTMNVDGSDLSPVTRGAQKDEFGDWGSPTQ